MSRATPTRPAPARPAPSGTRSIAGTAATIDPFRVIRRHLLLLSTTAIFALILGVGVHIFLFFVFPLFSAQVLFEVQAQVTSDEVVAREFDKSDPVVRIARTESLILLSPQVLRLAVTDPDVRQTQWARQFQDAGGTYNSEDAIEELTETMVARYLPDTNFFELAWSAPPPNTDVMTILNAVAKQYLRLRRDMDATEYGDDLKVFQRERDDLVRQIDDKNHEIQTHVDANNITTLDQIQSHPLTAEVYGLNKQIAELRSALAMMSTSYQLTAGKLGGEVLPTEEDRRNAQADPTIQILLRQIVSFKTQHRALMDKFGPDHPGVKEIERTIKAAEAERDATLEELMEHNLTAQLRNLTNQIETYNRMVDESQGTLAEKQTQVNALAAQVTKYESLLDNREQLNLQLRATQERISELQSLRLRAAAARVKIATLAEAPREKSFPKWYIIVPLVFLLVVGLTTAAVFGREMTDKRVKTASDLAILPGARVLGMIPDLDDDPTKARKAELAVRDEPRSIVAESYRQCCTPIVKGMEAKSHQSLVVVGALPGSGATTVVTNLAASMSAAGKRVLVIDANFRRPVLAGVFGTEPDKPGLGDLLSGNASVAAVISDCGDGVDLISAGTPGSRVFERLNNGVFEQMLSELRPKYDYVLVDSPPAVVAGDAMVLANKTDASVLVVRAHKEQRGLVARLINQFNEAHGELLGLILNRPRWTAGGYFKKNFATMAEYAGKASA